MKAALQRKCRILLKNSNLFWLAVSGITAALYGYRFTQSILPAVFFVFCLNPVLSLREDARRKGYEHQYVLMPYGLRHEIYADYLLGQAFCFLYVLILQFFGPWPARFIRLFPCLPLAGAAAVLPWHYVTQNRKTERFLTGSVFILWIAVFSSLRSLPVVIEPPYVLTAAGLNLLMTAAFAASMAYAASMADKYRGAE